MKNQFFPILAAFLLPFFSIGQCITPVVTLVHPSDRGCYDGKIIVDVSPAPGWPSPLIIWGSTGNQMVPTISNWTPEQGYATHYEWHGLGATTYNLIVPVYSPCTGIDQYVTLLNPPCSPKATITKTNPTGIGCSSGTITIHNGYTCSGAAINVYRDGYWLGNWPVIQAGQDLTMPNLSAGNYDISFYDYPHVNCPENYTITLTNPIAFTINRTETSDVSNCSNLKYTVFDNFDNTCGNVIVELYDLETIPPTLLSSCTISDGTGFTFEYLLANHPYQLNYFPQANPSSSSVQSIFNLLLSEVCNGIDDDCDGYIDEGVQSTFYADADGDGYGDGSQSTMACSAPGGYVANDDDCDDANIDANPATTEVCNGVDDNCDGTIDEGVLSIFYADSDGDGFGDPASTTMACTVPGGYVSNNDDCDDASINVNPAATELCNSIDDNCDGTIDEGCWVCNLTVSLPTCRTVYLGYAPAASTTLTPAVSGSNGSPTYQWSNGATTASITVSPTSTTTYSITVYDGENCSATASALVEVVDVRCGNNNNKVEVCHNNSSTMCLNPNAVPDHLAHGDALGACGTSVCQPFQPPTNMVGSAGPHSHDGHVLQERLLVFPNPAGRVVTIAMSPSPTTMLLEIENSLGVKLASERIEPGTDRHVVDVSALPPGIYTVRAKGMAAVQFVKQ